MRAILLLSVLIFNCNSPKELYPAADTIIQGQLEWQKKFYFDRIAEFKEAPIGNDKIVFLGNSIMQGGGNWNKKFSSKNIVNRGISGDYTQGLLKRLDEIIFYKPIAVFIMIGINEFFADNSDKPEITPKYVAENIFIISDIIKSNSPNTKIFIHTILPINNRQYMKVKDVNYNFLQDSFIPSVNKQVEITNAIIRNNKKYNIVDLYPLFLNNDLMMDSNMSDDGVHLNEIGYRIWVEETTKLIKDLNS